MADDGLDGLEDGGTSACSGKKGGMGGALPGLLKWVAIALGAIILIVVIVVVRPAVGVVVCILCIACAVLLTVIAVICGIIHTGGICRVAVCVTVACGLFCAAVYGIIG